MKKLHIVLIVLALIAIPALYFYLKAPTHNIASDHVDRAAEVDQWDLQSTYDMVIDAYDDPKIPVTCTMSHIVDDFSFTDPSNMAVTCRQTGYISPEQFASLPKSEDVFSRSKGVGFKSIYIRRSIDTERNMINYVAYSSTLVNGSFKNSISSISLFENKPEKSTTVAMDISECMKLADNMQFDMAERCIDAVHLRHMTDKIHQPSGLKAVKEPS